MKNALVVATLFLVIAAIACKKDDDDDNNQQTTFEMITSATWKIDTIGWDMNKDGSIDGAIALPACELDNTLTFSTDSTGVFDEGASKCDAADEQATSFTWTLNDTSSPKVLNIEGDIPGELEGEVTILSVNDTALVLSKHVITTFPVQFDSNLIVELHK